MKFSLNTILAFNQWNKTADNIVPNGVDDLLQKIGAQLGEIDETVDFGTKYDGVVIVKVVECVKHPDADKLSLCRVDDGGVVKDVERGEDGLVQVVCGAPNCREGIMAAWLPPGATVPSSVDDDPFVLEARELRGKVSNGMLASPKELDLGESHDGILEVDGHIPAGTAFVDAYNLKDDLIIDIENKMFTHRPDLFGFIGIARELAGIQGIKYKSPEWYVSEPKIGDVEGESLTLEVINELPELVPRFTAIAMSDVKVGPSPGWLVVELAKLGQKSINNIVDLTNYIMLSTSQPLHAYDYDKVKALSGDKPTIVIRNPHKGEKLALLNGKSVEPRAEAIMIATDKQLIGVGGIMGGSETEVDDNTTNIIIECANFDMYSIRRTVMAHGLFTDAATRFTKGQSPLQNLAVQSNMINSVKQHAGGKIASAMIDDNHLKEATCKRGSLHPEVKVSVDFINVRLGLNLKASEVAKLLTNVEFEVEASGDDLTVKAPFWRTDIELREDIVEEVGRLYGYDHLPLSLPAHDLTPANRNESFDLKSFIRNRLSRAGANEVLGYSFVHGNLLEKVGQDPKNAFEVGNALSPDLQYYRLSLMPSLLEKIHPNIKAGYDEFALFEIGKTHSLQHPSDDDEVPQAYEFTGLVVTAADKLKKSGAAYYQAAKYLENLAGLKLRYEPLTKEMQAYDVAKPYNPDRSASVSLPSGDFLGIIGEFKPSVLRNLKLPKYTAGFEVDTTILGYLMNGMTKAYHPPFKYPSVKQDMTLKLDSKVTIQQLLDDSEDIYKDAKPEGIVHHDIEVLDIFQRQDDQEHKQVTLRFTTTGMDRTLTDKEVGTGLDKFYEKLKSKLGAERI